MARSVIATVDQPLPNVTKVSYSPWTLEAVISKKLEPVTLILSECHTLTLNSI
jgi:hypothetical protein